MDSIILMKGQHVSEVLAEPESLSAKYAIHVDQSQAGRVVLQILNPLDSEWIRLETRLIIATKTGMHIKIVAVQVRPQGDLIEAAIHLSIYSSWRIYIENDSVKLACDAGVIILYAPKSNIKDSTHISAQRIRLGEISGALRNAIESLMQNVEFLA